MAICGSTNTSTGEPCNQPVPNPGDTCWREGHVHMGRPRKHLPEDAAERIEKLAGYGLTQKEIGDLWGVSDKTILRRLKEDDGLLGAYAQGRADYRRSAHKRLRDIAFNRKADLGLDEDVPVSEQRKTLVWIEKSQFGASEKHEFEHTGPDGGPVTVREMVINRPSRNGDEAGAQTNGAPANRLGDGP